MRFACLSVGLLLAGCSGGDELEVDRVDAVIDQMTEHYDNLRADCDHRALFALTYLRTTEEFRAALLEPGFFREPEYALALDVVFARLYFEAFDAWEADRSQEVPPAWEMAFEASTLRSVSTFGDILLGVSAHINRDLAFAAVEVGLESADGRSRKRDYDKVNAFLARVAVTEDIQRDLDPDFDVDYAAGLPFIEVWRESAWQRATALVASSDEPTLLEQHEREAEDVGASVVAIYGLDDDESTEARDVYCASRRGG